MAETEQNGTVYTGDYRVFRQYQQLFGDQLTRVLSLVDDHASGDAPDVRDILLEAALLVAFAIRTSGAEIASELHRASKPQRRNGGS